LNTRTFDNLQTPSIIRPQHHQTCENCEEYRRLCEELEGQVNQTKLRIDTSTDVIKKMDREMDEGDKELLLVKEILVEIA